MLEPLEEDDKDRLDALFGWLKEQGGQIHDDIYFARGEWM